MIPDELRAIMEPRMHKLVMVRRGVYLVVCAGCALDYRVRLAQVRNAITMELNAIPAADDNGGPDSGPAPPTTTAGDGPFDDGGEGDGEDLFSDGGEDDEGPEIGGGMECWDEGDGPAATFGGGARSAP